MSDTPFERDPQNAIDHGLYPASARPSGLEVPMTEQQPALAQSRKECAQLLVEHLALKQQVQSLITSEQMCVGAAGIGDFSELCGWIDDKKQQVESLEKQIKHACEDWAEDDTAIRNLCRPFLTEETCDHDGYAVVPVVDAVKNSLESLEKQCAAMRSAFENITTKLPQPYMPVPTYYEVACTQWKELEDCFDNATAGRDYFKVCPRCKYPATTARDTE